jgi:hypothetical protein
MLGFRARDFRHSSLASGRTLCSYCGADPSRAKNGLPAPVLRPRFLVQVHSPGSPLICCFVVGWFLYYLPAHCTPAQPAGRTAPKKGGGAVISTLLVLMFYLDLQVRVRARGLVSQLVPRDVCASGHGHPGLWLITNKLRTTPPLPALCVCLLPSASAFCVICRLACSPWYMSHVIT